MGEGNDSRNWRERERERTGNGISSHHGSTLEELIEGFRSDLRSYNFIPLSSLKYYRRTIDLRPSRKQMCCRNGRLSTTLNGIVEARQSGTLTAALGVAREGRDTENDLCHFL